MGKRTVKAIAAVGLVSILLAGCSLMGATPESKQSIDPPPEGSLTEDVLGEHWHMDDMTGTDEDTGELAPVTLYLEDANGNVAPVTMKVPMTQEIAQRALEYMIEGSEASEQLPTGFAPLIPAGTTLTMDIREEEKLAIVDFSASFAQYEAKDERKIVEAITWMLTSFPTIDQVTLRLNGEPLQQMPVNGFPLQEPLTRAIGINVQSIDGINLAASQPVTLYFKSETADAFEYLVPVTRMIERDINQAEAVLQELIKGPSEQGLYAVLSPDTKVLDVAAGEELVTIDFNDYVLDPEFRILEESMQSVVLTLTENKIAGKVQIKVNGSVEVLSSDDRSLTQPVTRPDHINLFGL